MMRTRGQGAAEYALVLAVVAAFVASVALQGFRDNEFNLAIAAGRHAAYEYTLTTNTSLTLAGMDYQAGPSNITLAPRLYSGTSLITNASALAGFRDAVLQSVRRTLRPSMNLTNGGACVQAATALYCCCG